MSTRPLCKYYLSNACTKGSACAFSHDAKPGASKPDNVCKYYLAGNCSYGKGCRYDHVRPKKVEAAKPAAKAVPKPVPVTYTAAPVITVNSFVVLNKKPGSGKLYIDAAPFVPSGAPSGPGPSSMPPGAQTQPDMFDEYCDENADFREAGGFEAQRAQGFSYAARAKQNLPPPLEGDPEDAIGGPHGLEEEEPLCPYGSASTECTMPNCKYLHGLPCPCCQRLCLHPNNPAQRDAHIDMCVAQVEESIKETEALKQSEDVECSICMEVVMDKPNTTERRFGLLENCNHPFCLKCIRNWRSSSGQTETIRTCPICRAHSNFITPSSFWLNDPEEKRLVIAAYQDNMKTIDCKHFDYGNGTCPFGTSCFYRHTTRDGKEVTAPKARYRFGAESGELAERVQDVRLWDFFARRDETM